MCSTVIKKKKKPKAVDLWRMFPRMINKNHCTLLGYTEMNYCVFRRWGNVLPRLGRPWNVFLTESIPRSRYHISSRHPDSISIRVITCCPRLTVLRTAGWRESEWECPIAALLLGRASSRRPCRLPRLASIDVIAAHQPIAQHHIRTARVAPDCRHFHVDTATQSARSFSLHPRVVFCP